MTPVPLFCLALACCARELPEPPSRLSLEPNEGPNNRETSITIRGDFLIADLAIDYHPPSVGVLGLLTAQLGDVPLLEVRATRRGEIAAVVPIGLLADTSYDLIVTDGAGRSSRLPEAFRSRLGTCGDLTESDGAGCPSACENEPGCVCREARCVPIRPPNRPPLAVDDAASTSERTPLTLSVLANDSDPDGDPLAITDLTRAGSGTAAALGDAITYTPSGVAGSQDRFTYTVSDGRGGTASAAVVITIVAAPLPTSPLEITPAEIELNVNSGFRFSAAGGAPPYTFTVSAGSGDIDPTTGYYFSSGEPGPAEVTVTDAALDTRTAEVKVDDGDLWVIGGLSTELLPRPEDGVWRSSDGSDWTLAGSIPQRSYLASAVVFDARIWMMGGLGETSVLSDVWSSTDGATWTHAGDLPVPLRGSALVVFAHRMWLIGGRDSSDAYRADVWSSADGATWALQGMLPTPLAYGSAFVLDQQVWYVAGADPLFAYDDVYSSADGATWTRNGRVPAPRYDGSVLLHKGRPWLLGGANAFGRAQSSVWTGDGGGTWSQVSTLPGGRGGAGAVALNGLLYFVGGYSGSQLTGTARQEVWSSADGLTWTSAGTLPTGLMWASALAFDP